MKTTLFTVGPVEMFPEVLRMGAQQLPYFRTDEFSATALACDTALRSLAGAPPGARSVLLTCSGTGAMEAAVINFIGVQDRALIVNGGSFGERFCRICETHGILYDTMDIPPGKDIDPAVFSSLDLSRYTALLVNAHETSTGALYDLQALGDFCKKAGILFIVDAISSFLCDPLHMERMHIDALIISSQKALGLPPGLSMLLMSPRLVETLKHSHPKTFYFDLHAHLRDMERGQTPFTPAVGIVLQLHERLQILMESGVETSVSRCAALASHFRQNIAGLPFRMFPERPSNALTALAPTDGRSAYDIYMRLKTEYGLVVTPNGGALRDLVFRVGHMGNVSAHDFDDLAHALKEISR